jgi:hypothetical protein
MSFLNLIGRFSRLEPKDKRLLFSSFFLQAGIRLALWLVPLSKVQRLAFRWPMQIATSNCSSPVSEKRVLWAVNTTSRLVPKCTCFVRALAAQVMLHRAGFDSELRIGVAKGEGGELKGHAWVERESRVVIGDSSELSRYTLLPLRGTTSENESTK